MEINISDIIFGAINFFIMAFILNKLLFQPVMRVIEQRNKQLEAMQQETAAVQKDIEAEQAQYEAVLAEANKKAQEIIDEAAKAGEETREKLVAEARANSQEMLAQARRDLAEEMAKAKLELKDEVAELSLLMAGKLLNKPFDSEEHKKAVEEIIAGLAGSDTGVRISHDGDTPC